MIEISIETEPLSLKRHRHTKFGHVYNPSLKDMKVFHDLALCFKKEAPLAGGILMMSRFVFTRPKNHYRSGKYSHLLKPNHPTWHIIKPDTSNLVKFYEDALGLSTNFFYDDKQICESYSTKEYGESPLVEIKLIEINYEPEQKNERRM